VLARSLLSAARSTTFLAVFCSGYQAFVCVQRHWLERGGVARPDHKLWYYVAGLFSSLSILIERKSRRSELALYAFPRALDSLYMILYDRQLAFRVPQGEALLFASAMAVVMWSHQNAPDTLSPLVTLLLQRFLPSDTHGQLASSKAGAGAGARDADDDSASNGGGSHNAGSNGGSGNASGEDRMGGGYRARARLGGFPRSSKFSQQSLTGSERSDDADDSDEHPGKAPVDRSRSTVSLSGGYTIVP
jgi:hypothetical protein